MGDYTLTSLKGQDMLEALPSYYQTVRESRLLAQTEGLELDDLTTKIDGVLDQAFIETATWGLTRWETEFGITPPAGQPIEQRRSVVRSRIRGTGTVTEDLIKRVAESYLNGEVAVTQHTNLYTVTVTFMSELGIPPNIDDIKQAVRSILPAHLDVEYAFSYVSFGMLEGYGKSFGNIEAAGLTFGDLEVWGG
ncbi:hypothetical protein Back11_12120 [Paenibacillus baekrokdamisoli]|uniref:Uncharacterized protein n=1 Tax=Paenibacillus baekrokdamisoli TaxID=1712516 RepID=A0A3G9ILN9_9BACL|nr:putative phage tail protein [Paenibacillus baekrokdamisoli]MBB3070518.1 hypothetical protein [Paenibacillus baekrokdamisoli]BBH19867.1 hypothetical protein Back11_12120 [Paenibacillus baekrokdamisoli]